MFKVCCALSVMVGSTQGEGRDHRGCLQVAVAREESAAGDVCQCGACCQVGRVAWSSEFHMSAEAAGERRWESRVPLAPRV